MDQSSASEVETRNHIICSDGMSEADIAGFCEELLEQEEF